MAEDVFHSYLLPFRDDGRGRLDSLLAVLGWVAPLEHTEFLVIEQDRAPCAGISSLPDSVRHVFLFNPGPFNKSWAFNVGAKNARGEVLALADVDILVDASVIQACLNECRGKFEAINPYSELVDLDLGRTETFRRTGDLVASQQERINRDYKGEYLCFCGGLYVIRKSAYLRLGGQDERFLGWGGEDDVMSIKIGLLEKTATNRSALAYHLFHEPASARISSDVNYRQNMCLLEDYRQMSKAQLEALCRAQNQSMGDPNKYARKKTEGSS